MGKCVNSTRPTRGQKMCQEYSNAGLKLIRGNGLADRGVVFISPGNVIEYPNENGRPERAPITRETEPLWTAISNGANDYSYDGPETVPFSYGDQTIRVTYENNRVKSISGLERKAEPPPRVASAYKPPAQRELTDVVKGKR